MIDINYDPEKIQEEAQSFIDSFKVKMKAIAEETLGELYSKVMPYIETDTWTNYREALRMELEHEYKYSKFKKDWATSFRRAVFVENREEISNLIGQDIIKRIKFLEDLKQEFEMFRYSPLGDTYQCLRKERDDYREALSNLENDDGHIPAFAWKMVRDVLDKYPKEKA